MAEIFGFDVFRTESAAGQEVVTGLSWDVLVLFTFVAFLVFLVHYIVRDVLNPADHTSTPGGPSVAEVESSLKEQGVEEVERFTAAQRASHWIMAIAVFLLMLSGFLMMNTDITLQTVAGISWLNVHIIFSLVFLGYLVFHIGHVAYKGTWMAMWIGRRELEDLWARFMNLIGRQEEYPRQLKYPSAQKFLHLGVTVASLGVIVTGLVLLRRVEVPFLWDETREFSVLGLEFGLGMGQPGWGLVTWNFVLHDLFAITMVGLVLGHVYFALRPNEWGITRSMITGTISAETYAEKYSPRSWNIGATPASSGDESDVENEGESDIAADGGESEIRE